MSEEHSLLIKEYAQNPLCNFTMKNYTVKRHEGNFICWDEITVYLLIEGGIIKEYSFDGNCSTITKAASSFFSELVIGAKISEVLTWNYETIQKNGFEVSPRRRRAAVIALMGCRNAIHEYLKDGKEDVFDDLIDR